MHIEKLSEINVYQYIAYLKEALANEPDLVFVDHVNEQEIVDRVQGSFPHRSCSLLAVEEEKVIGRIEYHFYSCIQDGYKMAYVDWIYVSASHRHRGVARALFRAFENDCAENDIDEYFLLPARNENASRFYGSFTGASLAEERVLRKTLK